MKAFIAAIVAGAAFGLASAADATVYDLEFKAAVGSNTIAPTLADGNGFGVSASSPTSLGRSPTR